MGKRKSAKPQKYIQPSEDEDEADYSEAENAENIAVPSLTEKNVRSLWDFPKKEQNKISTPKESVEAKFWASHFPIKDEGIVSNNNSKFDFNSFHTEPSSSADNLKNNPLGALLSERIFNSNPIEDGIRGRKESGSSGDGRSGRPKRRRKYVTYPATFRLEVVEHAERFGKNSAAKKYNICVEKVSMWCKTKDNIVHKVKKGVGGSMDGSMDERGEEMQDDDEIEEERRNQVTQELDMLFNEDSDASDHVENEARATEIVFPQYFKRRVVARAEEIGIEAAAREFKVGEVRLTSWVQSRDYLNAFVESHHVEPWEIDLYISLKRLLEENQQVTVRELIVRAEQAQLLSNSSHATISTAWLTDWCNKFHVCFRSVADHSSPQALTENTCLFLETSLYAQDRDFPKNLKVQELIENNTNASSPSASDREDSLSALSFNSRRRRRSYTLAFRLEVVKFAQSHTKHATSRKYGIARRVISRWIADKEVLQSDLQNANNNNTDNADRTLLHYYRELRRKGERVTRSVLVERANTLQRNNGWLQHWLVRHNDDVHLDPDEPPPNQPPQEGSLNALKQAYMANAILSSLLPNDTRLVNHFPELLNAIQQNPAILAGQESPYNFAEQQDKKVKKRRERYSPDFKLTVIEYAASHSYQETSRKFGVHHITVSEWCKDKDRIRKKVCCDQEGDIESLHSKILKSETAEQKFLTWIQDCNKRQVVIRPGDVQAKANEILGLIGEAEVKKHCWWFYLWNKRALPSPIPEDEERDSRVNYPPALKVEIAKVAERQSVNCAAKCFRVARKRVREWVKSKDRLKWLAETGRERSGRSDYLDVDREVFEWYSVKCKTGVAPQLIEIRTKAMEIFQLHGFSNMKCSRDWYKSWCRRYGICRSTPKDAQLIRWILTRYDKNLPVTHQALVDYVLSEKMKCGIQPNEKPPEEYVFSFCKRYPRLLEALPGVHEAFPPDMENEAIAFRASLAHLQQGFSPLGIGCMDEVPLLFMSEGRVILNSGASAWNAVVFLSCLASGTLLPPFLVLRGQPFSTAPTRTLFRDRPPLVDQHVVCRWLEEVWLDRVPSPSLLLLDCWEPHRSSTESMRERGVTPLLLPEGCATRLQPLNAHVTRAFQMHVQELWALTANTIHPEVSLHEVARCVMTAFDRLQDQPEIVRRSFAVAGIAQEDDGERDWGSEHVLSPATSSDSD